MRNLWLFIIRNNAFFLFLLFEVLAVFLLIQNNNYQRATMFNSANALVGSVYEKANNISDYLILGRVNDSLAAENARLKSMLPKSFYSSNIDSATVIDSTLRQRYTYINAKVVNNTVIYRNNSLTLNRGSLHGVKTGMGVIGPNGVVGIVKDVSKHFCTVYSLLHKDVKVSVKLEKSNNIGSLTWPGTNPQIAVLDYIPTHVNVNKGERVMTTGFSLFPENTLAGTVLSIESGRTNSFLEIRVKLSVDFRQLQYVYIVTDTFQKEKQGLEEEAKK